MKFCPLHDHIVVKCITAEEKTSDGIIIPNTAKKRPMEGKVVAAGLGARNEQSVIVALNVKADDRVLFKARFRNCPFHVTPDVHRVLTVTGFLVLGIALI